MLFSHKKKFNFDILPNEYKCTRCGAIEKWNMRSLRWEKV